MPAQVMDSITIRRRTPCGTLHLVIAEDGGKVLITAKLGKNGHCPNPMIQTLGGVVSAVPVERIKEVAELMKGVECTRWSGDETVCRSCVDAFGEILLSWLRRREDK